MRLLPASTVCRVVLGVTLVAAISAPALALAGGRGGAHSSPRGQDQRRRHAAAELRRQGWDVDWRLATLPELRGWVQRAAEARSLRQRFGITVDWRSSTLGEMKDWQMRIALAADLRRFGVEADWRLFSARQLGDLRAFLEHEREHGGGDAPILPPPNPFARPPEALRLDPDAVLLPTYVVEELVRGEADDGVLEATYTLPRSKLRRARLTEPDGAAGVGSRKSKDGKAGKLRRAYSARPDT